MMPSSKKQSGPPLKIVVDTNLYLSLFVFRSAMLHHMFALVTDEKLTLYTSPPQLTELTKKFLELGVLPAVYVLIVSLPVLIYGIVPDRVLEVAREASAQLLT